MAALESLDVAASRLATMLVGVPAGRVKSALGGAWLGHAVHPMLVVVPIGAWTSATVLDLVGGAASARASRLLIGVGVAAAVPTAMTGLLDWSDRAPDHDAVRRVGLLHAATNSTALCLYGASLIARRRNRHARGVHLAVAGFGVLSFGDWLGGHLALGRGMGANQTAFATLPRVWTAVGDASVLTGGQPARATAGELDVVLVAGDDKLCALVNRCSHCGSLLHLGDVLGDCIVCPRHGTRFGLDDGSLRHGPGAYPQPSLQVRVRGSRVEVRAAGVTCRKWGTGARSSIDGGKPMADLTPLDEKLGEVLGLARAAQDATAQVASMEGADELRTLLKRMGGESAETERRTDTLVDTIDGRKTAIRELAAETKSEAKEMMKTYLAGEDEALDGFEFLTMAEAAELGHWEIVKVMSDRLGDTAVSELADWAVTIQRGHVEGVREGCHKLAAAEAA